MTMDRHKARPYPLKPRPDKIIDAILCILHEAHRKGVPVTQYHIVKSLFLADRRHLNQYGRPITFDNYFAMQHGPVPSLAYDILKEKPTVLRRYGIRNLPWTRKRSPDTNAFIYSSPARGVSEDVLSPSDMEALKSALDVVCALTFGQLRKLTHEDPAYIDAWEEDGGGRRYPISLAMLFEAPDYERAEEIQFLSQHQ